MEQYSEIVQLISLTLGVAWASGINLYAAIAMLGMLGATGNYVLPPGLEVLQDPLVIAAAGFMYCVEFFVDKTPGVDTGWDAIHSFIRIPAGAVLAAGAIGELGMGAEVAAAIVGGGMAATTHAFKSGSRVIINTSPEPVTNWTASVAEDVAVFGGLWAALHHPWWFLAALFVFILLMIWLLPKVWRGVVKVFRWITGLFSGRKAAPDVSSQFGSASKESPELIPDPGTVLGNQKR